MSHIITHNGRTYDLTALKTPFGLLPKFVKIALKNWPHGREIYRYDETGNNGEWVDVLSRFEEWDIIRAKPDQPAHIVTHEGRDYDLTALDTPFGLLLEPVQEALGAWPHGVEMMTYSGQMIEYNFPDMKGKRGAVWRAKPAPVDERVPCYRGEYYTAKEHGTCIKRNGEILWDTWEPEA